jgi:hypothetical protein
MQSSSQQQSVIANPNQLQAQAQLHHAWLLGLMLMVVTRKGAELTGEWMFRLFRRQHLAKFLSSFNKLGLDHLPHAVACAQYHVLSNQIGGVSVEFMPESDRKAWLRFRYPRWMYAGPTLCAMPIEVSRGFLRGWYAHNGVSLGNPKLGFVCVSEDMSDGFGLCGYFQEYDEPLEEHQRLQFSDELPPAFDGSKQPRLAPELWSAQRLAEAQRSYALEYLRNGISELIALLGSSETLELASRSARLIGMQYYREIAEMIDARDGSADDAAAYLISLFQGMVDEIEPLPSGDQRYAIIRLKGLRITRGLSDAEAGVVGSAWCGLAQGAVGAHQNLMRLNCDAVTRDEMHWQIAPLRGRIIER